MNTNADCDAAVFRQQLLQQFQPGAHHAQPLIVAGQVLALLAHHFAQPLFDLGVIDVVIVHPALVAGIIGWIYVPADFDTREKALSGAKAAENGLK